MKKARSLARSVHSLEELVEEQCQRAELSARAMSVQPPEPGEQWPVITISSEAGAGGKQLGENIAKNFAFAFWGSQLLARVAKELHAVESVLADVDGRVSSSVTDFVRSLLVGLE
jgi:hypothetical protein